MNNDEIARRILENVGGNENIVSIMSSLTPSNLLMTSSLTLSFSLTSIRTRVKQRKRESK